MRGFGHVKFFVSGGINEKDIPILNPVVQGYGIGTYISNAPVIDFAMDIVEVDGQPLAKRGKWSGSKSTLVCSQCGARKIVPKSLPHGRPCPCGGICNDILVPIFDGEKQLVDQESPSRIREEVLWQIQRLDL